jgi:hypothetical protein
MARWRKQKSETGLARICQGPRGYELYESGVSQRPVMHVSPKVERPHSYTIVGWYWYGYGHNSLSDRPLFLTANAAKTDAVAFRSAKLTANNADLS